VSLTISKIFKDGFQVVIIPQTLKLTNLIYLKNKVLVNLEFDVIGKYINSFLK
jgi:riboflavin synthase